MKTQIKICGMTSVTDALAAAELGVDYLGLNFVGGPRKMSFEQAAPILRATQNRLERVALIGDAGLLESDDSGIRAALDKFELIQHYDSYNHIRKAYNRGRTHFWMVLRASCKKQMVTGLEEIYSLGFKPFGILIDASVPGTLGGSGHSFDWNWIKDARESGELKPFFRLILAGGLTPENVAEAIRIARPSAVDVSSGVEVAGKPGIKDPIKMRDFVQAVRGADIETQAT